MKKSKLMKFTRDKSDAGEMSMLINGQVFTTPRKVEVGTRQGEKVYACGQKYLGFACDTHMAGVLHVKEKATVAKAKC